MRVDLCHRDFILIHLIFDNTFFVGDDLIPTHKPVSYDQYQSCEICKATSSHANYTRQVNSPIAPDAPLEPCADDSSTATAASLHEHGRIHGAHCSDAHKCFPNYTCHPEEMSFLWNSTQENVVQETSGSTAASRETIHCLQHQLSTSSTQIQGMLALQP